MSSPRNILPFPFESLKKLSASQSRVLRALSRALPADGLESQMLTAVTGSLQKHLGPQFSLGFEDFAEASFGQVVSGIGTQTVTLVVSLTPFSKKIIITLDSELAFSLIDKLLGGNDPSTPVMRALTALETGVLEFLAVKVLRDISGFLENTQNRAVLEQVQLSPEALGGLEEPSEKMAVLLFTAGLQKTKGVIKIIFPFALAEEVHSRQERMFQQTALGASGLPQARLKKLESLKMICWAELGRAQLTSADLSQLTRGDIILLDEVYPQYDGTRLSGSVHLLLGDGSHGGFEAQIQDAKGQLKVALEAVLTE